MTFLEQAWAFVRQWWWALLAGIVGILAWVLASGGGGERSSRVLPPSREGDPESNVEASKRFVEERIERARQDAEIAAAKREARIDRERERLKEIKSEEDTEKRRRRLSEYLTNNL